MVCCALFGLCYTWGGDDLVEGVQPVMEFCQFYLVSASVGAKVGCCGGECDVAVVGGYGVDS